MLKSLLRLLLHVFILCTCLSSLFAEDGFFYGSTQRQTAAFERINIATGESSIIAAKAHFGNTVGNTAIDVRRDIFAYTSGLNKFIRVDLITGELVSEVEIEQTGLNGLHYDYGSDSFYSTFDANGHKLLVIDAEDNSTRIVNLQAGPGRLDVCSSMLDGSRGWFMILSTNKVLYVYNISSGALLYEHSLDDAFAYPVYNPLDQQIYAIKVPFGGTQQETLELAKIDPLRGVVTLQPIVGSNFRNFIISRCSKGFHAKSGTYCVFLRGGLMCINVNVPIFRWYTEFKNHNDNDAVVYNSPAGVFKARGRIYFDVNQNCTFDEGDDVMAGQFVRIEPVGIRVRSRSDGRFAIRLPEGNYTAIVEPAAPWDVACNTSSYSFMVNADGNLDAPLNIGLYPDEEITKLDLSLTQTRAIAGESIQYYLNYLNTGTLPFNGTIRFTHDELLTNFDALPAATRYSTSVAEWDLLGVSVGTAGQIAIDLDIPADEELRGQEICASTEVADGTVGDNRRYQQDKTCTEIAASFDPNRISVLPRGFGERGIISREDSSLAYTIQFQNIGNAPARNVVILDTLDSGLDLKTVHFGASSHAYSASVLSGNIVEFRFENIKLPGKEEDETNSHGSVKFKVDLNTNLAIGAEISNSAAIYFDFNKPVITNTVLNTLGELTTDVAELAKPDQLELRSLGNAIFVLHRAENAQLAGGTVKVFSVFGTKVLETALHHSETTTIDLRHQPSGRYLLRVESDAGVTVKSIAVIR